MLPRILLDSPLPWGFVKEGKPSGRSVASRFVRSAHEPSIPPARSGTFETFDGERLAYWSYGKGTALLCLNGLACDAMSWRYFVDYFAPKHRVVLFDYRGHGRSPAPRRPEDASVETNVRDAVVLMKALRLRKVVVVGHSMGGQVALELVHRHPERVRGMVLTLCAYRRPLSTLRDPAARRMAEPFLRVCCEQPELVKQMLQNTAAGPVGFSVGRAMGMYHPAYCRPKDWLHYLEHFASLDHRTYGHMALSLQRHDAGPYLPKIACPVLVIGGERDSISPGWIARKMHVRIPRSELLMLPRGSHIGHLEHDLLVNLRVEKFLRERVR